MPTSNYYGLVLAGGRGTRFWPRSRKKSAKQVLKFFGERSLIQQTVDRLTPLLPPERIWVITNDDLRDAIAKQLPGVPKKQIIAEPAQRNTAPAIGLVAQILRQQDPDAVMGVFPADHLIDKPARYLRLVKPAFRAADKGQIAVLGIQPRWAETGYGYIEMPEGALPGSTDLHKVIRFREKPDARTAEEFVQAGRFFWNAGMFFWKASTFMDELRVHEPEMAGLLESLPKFGSKKFGDSLKTTFPQCKNVSVDYAVLERSSNVYGLAADNIGWNDVGSWNAVFELGAKTPDANVSRHEDHHCEDSQGNLIDAPGKFVALLGVRDLVVVDTPDALLIVDRKRSQDVGALVKLLEKRNRHELL